MVNLSKVASRANLRPRRDPYWHGIAKGQALGFRKMTKTSEGTWSARFMDDATGKQQYKTLGSFTHLPPNLRFDAAVAQSIDWFKHLDRGGSSTSFTVGDACRRYIERTLTEKGASSAKDAQLRFNRRVFDDATFTRIELTKLTPSHIDAWRKRAIESPSLRGSNKGKQRTPSAFNRDMTCLKAALNLALQDGLITTDFAWKSKLAAIKNATKRRNIYIDRSERQKLLQACELDLRNLVHAACLLPLRPGAIASLTVSNFDSRINTLSVGKDKHGQDRKIPLPKATADFLQEMSKNKLPTAPLLSKNDGTSWKKDDWKKPFKKAAIAAGLSCEAVMYNLRHSVITDLVISGLDIFTVAQFSGTSVAMIEQHYGHLTREHGISALSSLAV